MAVPDRLVGRSSFDLGADERDQFIVDTLKDCAREYATNQRHSLLTAFAKGLAVSGIPVTGVDDPGPLAATHNPWLLIVIGFGGWPADAIEQDIEGGDIIEPYEIANRWLRSFAESAGTDRLAAFVTAADAAYGNHIHPHLGRILLEAAADPLCQELIPRRLAPEELLTAGLHRVRPLEPVAALDPHVGDDTWVAPTLALEDVHQPGTFGARIQAGLAHLASNQPDRIGAGDFAYLLVCAAVAGYHPGNHLGGSWEDWAWAAPHGTALSDLVDMLVAHQAWETPIAEVAAGIGASGILQAADDADRLPADLARYMGPRVDVPQLMLPPWLDGHDGGCDCLMCTWGGPLAESLHQEPCDSGGMHEFQAVADHLSTSVHPIDALGLVLAAGLHAEGFSSAVEDSSGVHETHETVLTSATSIDTQTAADPQAGLIAAVQFATFSLSAHPAAAQYAIELTRATLAQAALSYMSDADLLDVGRSFARLGGDANAVTLFERVLPADLHEHVAEQIMALLEGELEPDCGWRTDCGWWTLVMLAAVTIESWRDDPDRILNRDA